jgi:hypothetical protein
VKINNVLLAWDTATNVFCVVSVFKKGDWSKDWDEDLETEWINNSSPETFDDHNNEEWQNWK